MNNYRQELKARLLANIPAQVLPLISLDPLLSHLEKEALVIVTKLPSISQLAGEIAPSDSQPSSVFALLFKIIDRILFDDPAGNPSIGQIAEYLLGQRDPTLPFPVPPNATDSLQQFTIAAVGWMTMLYSWQDNSAPGYCTVQGGDSLVPVKLHMENCSRSTGTFIRQFGLLTTREYPAEPDNILYLSMLNFHSLTHIGRLRIKWDPHISRHLLLDIPDGFLYLFKYPSICVLALQGGGYQELCNKSVYSCICLPLPADTIKNSPELLQWRVWRVPLLLASGGLAFSALYPGQDSKVEKAGQKACMGWPGF